MVPCLPASRLWADLSRAHRTRAKMLALESRIAELERERDSIAEALQEQQRQQASEHDSAHSSTSDVSPSSAASGPGSVTVNGGH